MGDGVDMYKHEYIYRVALYPGVPLRTPVYEANLTITSQFFCHVTAMQEQLAVSSKSGPNIRE